MADDSNESRPKKKQFTVDNQPVEVETSSKGTRSSLGGGEHSAPTKDQMKAVFMASKHIEWTPFAQSQGLDPVKSRASYPCALWIQEKRNIIAVQQAETIGEMIWDHKQKWHRDVLKTLTEYPEASDRMLAVVKHRINEIVDIINTDVEQKKMARQKGEPYSGGSFSKLISTDELKDLCTAVKILTDSKHKSLMIDQWSVRAAEDYTNPEQFKPVEETTGKDWRVVVKGGEHLSMSELERMMSQYYDQRPPDKLLESAQEQIPGQRDNFSHKIKKEDQGPDGDATG